MRNRILALALTLGLGLAATAAHADTHAIDVAPTGGDAPVVHKLIDLWQSDPVFQDLFASGGSSMLCGPTTLAMALLYLRDLHAPRYPQLFVADGLQPGARPTDVVRYLVSQVGTNDSGTNAHQLEEAAQRELQAAGYGVNELQLESARKDRHPDRLAAPTPQDLARATYSQYRGGADPVGNSDKAVILHFGWYHLGTGKRSNGHYVVLAGYDAKSAYTFYIVNPLIRYQDSARRWYSKITLAPVAASLEGHVPLPGMWQTADLIRNGDEVGVLEDVLTILPNPRN